MQDTRSDRGSLALPPLRWDVTTDVDFEPSRAAVKRLVETPFLCVELVGFRRGQQWNRERATTTTVVQVMEGRVALTVGSTTANSRVGQSVTVVPGGEWAVTALERAVLQVIRSPHPDFADLDGNVPDPPAA
jgi:quercetin dioxygenase-like cupin family protein